MNPRNPALEAAILENPDDLSAYRVYADWLQEHGDRFGELVAVQLTLAEAPDSARSALLAEEARLRAEVLATLGIKVDGVTWRFGFMQTVEVGAEDLRTLLSRACIAFVERLLVRAREGAPEIARVVAKNGSPSLRSLAIWAPRGLAARKGESMPTARVRTLWKACPRLSRIEAHDQIFER